MIAGRAIDKIGLLLEPSNQLCDEVETAILSCYECCYDGRDEDEGEVVKRRERKTRKVVVTSLRLNTR